METIRSKNSYERVCEEFRGKISFVDLLIEKTLDPHNAKRYRGEIKKAFEVLKELNKNILANKKEINGSPTAISYQKKYIDFCQNQIIKMESKLNQFLTKIQNIPTIKKEIKSSKETLLTKKNEEIQYLFSLRNIYFYSSGFSIQYKENTKFKIPMKNCNNALNEIREELFKNRNYKGVLYFVNNKLDKSKSKIADLKSFLSKRLEINKQLKTNLNDHFLDKYIPMKPINNNNNNNNIVFMGEITSDKLKESTRHNLYLKAAADIINFEKADRVWGVKERYVSTDTIEEALLFIYYRSKTYHVLWENINKNRGGIMFMNIINIELFLEKLKKYLKEDKNYKRFNLRKNELPKDLENMNLRLENLNHTSHETYGNRIKNLLNNSFFSKK